MKMNSKMFAWLYLVKHGQCGTHSYYGGFDYDGTVIDRMQKVLLGEWKYDMWGMRSHEKIRTFALGEIKMYGVDWDKSEDPQSDYASQFVGTDAPSERKEVLRGRLVLKNGYTQFWEAEDVLGENVFTMMAEIHNTVDEFQEIFG